MLRGSFASTSKSKSLRAYYGTEEDIKTIIPADKNTLKNSNYILPRFEEYQDKTSSSNGSARLNRQKSEFLGQ